MKKKQIDFLNLDKEIIAKLDEAQLNEILGGKNDDADETNVPLCYNTTCFNIPTAVRP